MIASLAKLARRGSRLAAAYFVVTPGRKACPLPPPQHGGARSGLIASLAKLARRGSRLAAAYFVVTPGRKACPLPPPQHGGARSGLIASLAKLALSDGSLRSLRYRREAADFVRSDETIVPTISSLYGTFRRLLLQIGGANIAGADRAWQPPTSSDSELFAACAAKRPLRAL